MRKRIARYFCGDLFEIERTHRQEDYRLYQAQIKQLERKLAVFETQKATILKAAIDASERVALAVSQHGDNALKTYVDDCFQALISVHGAN